MKGMVDSFNVSVAAGILMHHAGCYGDLISEERQILLAEFSFRHSKSALSISHEYAKQKAVMCTKAVIKIFPVYHLRNSAEKDFKIVARNSK
uniref:Uncharacterized protein n=1 Tax=Quercus lobata TaxID=97700 RepID=A0A7N2KZF4_QUELO